MALIPLICSEHNESTDFQAAKRTTKRITAFENPQETVHELEPEEVLSTDHRVTTVVFELEHVLSTNIEKLRYKGVAAVSAMNPIRKQLCFGGVGRIEALQKFLERVHERNDSLDEGGGDSIKCFILANESSKMVLQLLMDCNLVKYFISRFGNQLVSHVIGWDHGMAQETNHKKHLILLKLMDSLGRQHEEMLYVGNDKEQMNHIRSIGLCRTFLAETQGLTEEAMNKIADSFF